MRDKISSVEKGSFLVEFLVSVSLFSIIALCLSKQLLMHSRMFKLAQAAKTEFSTNQDIVKVYSWFRGKFDHNESFVKTTLFFPYDFFISCTDNPRHSCKLHRNDKDIEFIF